VTRNDLERDLGKMLTVQEVADFLRCGPDKIRNRLIAPGRLPAIVVGRDYLVRSTDLIDYIDASRTDRDCRPSTSAA
jgi:excisionase family DNA binding protein